MAELADVATTASAINVFSMTDFDNPDGKGSPFDPSTQLRTGKLRVSGTISFSGSRVKHGMVDYSNAIPNPSGL